MKPARLPGDVRRMRRPEQEGSVPHQTQRDHDKDQDIDPAGERGGDTGKSSYVGDGPQAEKGDQRRDKPVHGGPTRPNAGGNTRSGSDSNASR